MDDAGQSYRWPAEWEPHGRPGSPGRTSVATGPASSRRFRGFTPRSSATLHQSETCRILVDDGRRSSAAARQCSATSGRRSEPRRVSLDSARTASGRATTARFSWSNVGRRVGADRLALQRLGQVPELARDDDAVPANWPRRKARPARRQPTCTAGASCWKAAASTCNGPGLAADDGGMPAQPVQQRNPRFDAGRLRSRSSPTISASKKVLWLNRGIAGDDTHGHVDDLARFVGPRTVVTVVEDEPGRRELSSRCKRTSNGCAA